MSRDSQPALAMDMNRRNFLRASGGAALAAFGLSACSEPSRDVGDVDLIEIPDTGADLPGDEVTFRWIDTGDAKAAFWDAFWPKYMEAHPNITVQYDGLPAADINDILPLGIRNNTAHDVFALTGNFVPAKVVADGWVAPIDDVVPNFDDWKAAFPPGTFIEGIHDYDGKTYTFPVASNKRYNNLLLTNPELLERADVDFGDEPPTWDEFREAARKLTETGDGQFYGVMMVGGPFGYEDIVLGLAHTAGRPNVGSVGLGFGLDPFTGEYAYTSDEVRAAVDLILALDADGSIFPGWHTISPQEAWPRLPRGDVAMVFSGFGGPWVPALWEQENPDVQYGAYAMPVTGDGDPLPLRADPAAPANFFWVNADSELKEVAGDVFAYIGSAEGQARWGHFAGMAQPPVFPEAMEALQEEATTSGAAVLALGESMVWAPSPIARNSAIAEVEAELTPPEPNFRQTLEAIVLGDIDDAEAALVAVKDAHERALDDAIAAAQAKGHEVSRDDLVFPNWDPAQDYTSDDYADL